MTRRIIVTPKADQDINDLFTYIAQDNLDAAIRFFDSTRMTFAQLARTPGIGNNCEAKNPRLQGLRKWAVKGFEKHLIFYSYSDEYMKVLRVLHGVRDIPTLLD
jgi:toxin ParE1/3/4